MRYWRSVYRNAFHIEGTGNIPAFLWKDWGKSGIILVSVVGFHQYIPNTKEGFLKKSATFDMPPLQLTKSSLLYTVSSKCPSVVVRYLLLHPYRMSGKLVRSYEYKVSHSANYMPCYCVDKSSLQIRENRKPDSTSYVTASCSANWTCRRRSLSGRRRHVGGTISVMRPVQGISKSRVLLPESPLHIRASRIYTIAQNFGKIFWQWRILCSHAAHFFKNVC